MSSVVKQPFSHTQKPVHSDRQFSLIRDQYHALVRLLAPSIKARRSSFPQLHHFVHVSQKAM